MYSVSRNVRFSVRWREGVGVYEISHVNEEVEVERRAKVFLSDSDLMTLSSGNC